MTAGGRREARTVLRNAASAYGHRLLLGLSVLLLTPYLFRGLGLEGFGTWSVMFTLATVAGLLEWGFAAGVGRLVAELAGDQRREDLRALVGEAMGALSVPGLLCGGALAAVGVLAGGLAAGGQGDAFATGMALIGAATVLRFPAAAWAATLVGLQRWELFALCRSVETAVFAAGAVVAVAAGGGPAAVAGAFAGALVAGVLAQAACARRAQPGTPLAPRLHDRRARRRLMRFSGWVLLADGTRFAGQQLDPVLIAALRGAAAAGPFAAAHKLQSALQSLTLPFVHLLMPMVAELWAAGRTDDVVRRLVLATRVSLQVTIPVAAGLALFASDVVDVWLGAAAPAVTASIVTVLMLAQTVSLASYPAEQVLVGLGRVRALGRLSVAEAVVNLSVTAVLVVHVGALGAAFGTLVTCAVLTPLRLPLACRATGLRMATLVRDGILPAVTGSALALVAMGAVWTLAEPGAARLAAGLLAGVLAAVGVGAVQAGRVRLRGGLALVAGRGQEARA